ncbi:MAG TPA: hypothetical protein VGM84_04530 [Steroidobacteraceae bacterium]
MQALFVLIHLGLLVYFIGRRFDLFTLAFYTSTVYFLPGYFGYASYQNAGDLQQDPLGLRIYAFYFAYYGLLFLCALLVQAPRAASGPGMDSASQNAVGGSERLFHFLILLRWSVPVLLVAAQLLTPGGLWQEDKQDLLDSASMAYPMFQNGAFVYLVIAVVRKSRLDGLLGAAYCLVDLALSFRSVTAFAFFALVTIYMMQKPRRSIALSCLVPVAIVGAFLFGSVYKSMVVRFAVDGVQGVTAYLQDPAAVGDNFAQNEAFQQQHIFNKVLETDFSVPTGYAWNMARLFFPGLANTLFGRNLSFNDYFQPALYPEVPWGMASNIWAEQYGAGGIVWLYLFVILFFLMLLAINKFALKLLAEGKSDKFLFVVVMIVPVLIFMHRNDLLYQLVLVRDMAGLLVIFGFLARIRTRPVPVWAARAG